MGLFNKKSKKDNKNENKTVSVPENNAAEEKAENLDFTETENTAEQITEDFTENTENKTEEPAEKAESKNKTETKEEAYFREIEERKESDPLIAVKLCGRDIFNAFAKAGQDPDGRINCNSFLFNIGCFAGYMTQAAVWKKYVKDQNMPVEEVFKIHKTSFGKDIYFCPHTNKYLCDGQLSYWALVGGMIMNLFPGTTLPDIVMMFEKMAINNLDEDYKIYKSVDPAVAAEKTAVAWKNLYPMINKYCPNPDEWATAVGIAVQNAMNISKDVLKPDVCFDILMECTIYMAKADISKTLNF